MQLFSSAATPRPGPSGTLGSRRSKGGVRSVACGPESSRSCSNQIGELDAVAHRAGGRSLCSLAATLTPTIPTLCRLRTPGRRLRRPPRSSWTGTGRPPWRILMLITSAACARISAPRRAGCRRPRQPRSTRRPPPAPAPCRRDLTWEPAALAVPAPGRGARRHSEFPAAGVSARDRQRRPRRGSPYHHRSDNGPTYRGG